jgi:hypothetical protein
LIIGGYGNGKTSIMRSLSNVLIGSTKDFRYYPVNRIVSEYEEINDSAGKEIFNKKYNRGNRCFDDVLSERNASNYGRINVFQDIFLNRYDLSYSDYGKENWITHINCNYRDGYEGDLENALDQFEERYTGRVYDRLFAMFNIIEFSGSSFRK